MGRKKKEPTKVIRIPMSLLDKVNALILKSKKKAK